MKLILFVKKLIIIFKSSMMNLISDFVVTKPFVELSGSATATTQLFANFHVYRRSDVIPADLELERPERQSSNSLDHASGSASEFVCRRSRFRTHV